MARYPSEFVVLVCFLLAIEVIIGLALNLYIMIRWYNDNSRKISKSKRNGNNFIITLKFFDLFICATAIPLAFTVLVVDSEQNLVVCFIKEGLVMFASSGSSFCVLLISVDRYIAVVWPTKHLLTPSRILTCRLTAVLFAVMGFVLPQISLFMGLYSSAKVQSPQVLPCRHVLWLFKPYYLYEIHYIVSFIIAVITTFLCYHSVLKVVKRRILLRTTTVTSTSTTGRDNGSNVDRFRKQEFKATRVAFAVVLSFLVCWGPHVIITVVQFSFVDSLVVDMIQSICLVIAFLTPVIHPVIYTYETNERKNAFTTSGVRLCVPCRKGGSRVTPEQTHIDSFKINSRTTQVLDQTHEEMVTEDYHKENEAAKTERVDCERIDVTDQSYVGTSGTVTFHLSEYTVDAVKTDYKV